jgi:PAS domain S-box-containing protein
LLSLAAAIVAAVGISAVIVATEQATDPAKPSLWANHSELVLLAIVVVIALLVLSGALLIHRSKLWKSEAELEERLRFERLVSEVSATLIAVPTPHINEEVHGALERVREAMDLDHCTAFVLSRPEGWARITHQVAAPGLPPFPNEWVESQVPVFFRELKAGRVVGLGDLMRDLPHDAVAERRMAKALHLRSLLMIPVAFSEDLVRGVTFESVRSRHEWNEDLISRLRLVGNILISTIAGRRAEEALRRSEERFREVVDSQPDLICRYLPDTTLTFVNEAYCKYFGRPREELIGRRFVELIPEESREAALEHVASLLENPRSERNEHQVVRSDGSIGWQQWVDHEVRGRDGRVVEFQAIGRDITDRKRAEEAMRSLTHASRLSLLGELTASIAHEINQPLGAILANADAADMLLESGTGSQDQIRAILAEIRREDLRASDVIRHVRSLVRRREAEDQLIDVNDVARGVLRLAGPDAERRGVVVAVELDGALPAVRGDRVGIEQVLLNLVINGMDAMEDAPSGTRLLTVRTERNGAGTVGVSVIDTGHGIPATLLPRLFDSFVTTRMDGMGLGLSISRSILEAHGGSIRAANNTDRGATIHFTLPAA